MRPNHGGGNSTICNHSSTKYFFLMQDSGIQDSGIFSQTFESPFVDEIMDQDNAFTRLKRDAEKISYLNYLFREYRSTLTIN